MSTLELSGATARLSHQPFTHTFTELAQPVHIRGLQGPRRRFYVMIFAVLMHLDLLHRVTAKLRIASQILAKPRLPEWKAKLATAESRSAAS